MTRDQVEARPGLLVVIRNGSDEMVCKADTEADVALWVDAITAAIKENARRREAAMEARAARGEVGMAWNDMAWREILFHTRERGGDPWMVDTAEGGGRGVVAVAGGAAFLFGVWLPGALHLVCLFYYPAGVFFLIATVRMVAPWHHGGHKILCFAVET